MFDKLLIANRGEIACRIIRTARRLGIRTVAVHSDADARALHVRMADEAVRIGPAPAGESYLLGERIVEACLTSGATAVHPGYGFLSERADFARSLERAGITFVGPPARAIEAMGDKVTSKRLAAEAGVSTVPGTPDTVADAEAAVRAAHAIGYPVMIKASAGGGGKGMRIARDDAGAREGFERSRSEAASSFGDERLFVERYVERPRHIEIQVLCDGHGHGIHLGERECSIQRRNQKIVEEAPSPFLDAATREAMGAQALALARTVGYASAGTVEFIVDERRRFYFLEMNTRLQVEHPVTELVTGIDLVEWMLRIAAGEPLTLRQEDVHLDGWAIEGRVYAEDPYRGYLPSTGRLVRYREPLANAFADGTSVRSDSGVEEGDEVSVHYDPMIAKLCAHGPTRTVAADAFGDALDRIVIDGIEHNVPLLAAIARHPRFRKGELTTAFLDEVYPEGFAGVEPDADGRALLLATAAACRRVLDDRARGSGGARFARGGASALDTDNTGAWSVGGSGHVPARSPRVVRVDGVDWWTHCSLGVTYPPPGAHGAPPSATRRFDIDIVRSASAQDVEPANPTARATSRAPDEADDSDAAEPMRILLDWRPENPIALIGHDGRWYAVRVDRTLEGFRLRHAGSDARYRVYTPRQAALATLMPERGVVDGEGALRSPMPGIVLEILAGIGDVVEAGQPLAIVEAMKMENVLQASGRATVVSVSVATGDTVSVGETLMEFEA